MIFDVDEPDFTQRVVERSRSVPVVVDFWAAWCGPCRALTPALERAASAREGKVDLAKMDVDRNQALAARFGVQGIPAVKGFKDGAVATEFTGAVPPAQVESFFDELVPSEADELAAVGESEDDEEALRRALELDPRHVAAARALARLLLARGEDEAAIAVLEPVPGDFVTTGLAARARLSSVGDELDPAFVAWDAGDRGTALALLQEAFEAADEADRRELVREAIVGVLAELAPDDPLAREHRRRLAAAMY